MQFTCQYNSVKYEGFKRQIIQQRSCKITLKIPTKKFFSETYGSDNNYIEKKYR